MLDQSGATFDSIVKLVVYLTDTTKLRDYARIKGAYIPDRQPQQ